MRPVPPLGEVPGLLTPAGGALCLAGVAVSRSRKRPAAPSEHAEPTTEPRREDAGRA
ncbi:hypothetical protein ACFW6Q_24780 [Streptomyces sp. NPDC058737]|uniref:hypothetical protein n=1 Tax=Streptomyces sp. NPDC058737 TaxID=3346617 RepID=UPI0036A5E01F